MGKKDDDGIFRHMSKEQMDEFKKDTDKYFLNEIYKGIRAGEDIKGPIEIRDGEKIKCEIKEERVFTEKEKEILRKKVNLSNMINFYQEEELNKLIPEKISSASHLDTFIPKEIMSALDDTDQKHRKKKYMIKKAREGKIYAINALADIWLSEMLDDIDIDRVSGKIKRMHRRMIRKSFRIQRREHYKLVNGTRG